MPWAIKWISNNRLDGRNEHLMGQSSNFQTEKSGYRIMCFRTRRQARDHVKMHYSYIKDRKDLREEPHGWRMPQVVKVSVTVTEDKS